jgi:anaphase-promoting complex subunit 6
VLYVQCLTQQKKSDELFLLSHDLVDQFPLKAIPWFGVGCYYFLIGKYVEAKGYFSKATNIDPSFGAAWIGYAHSFSLEGEHDQAISAYSHAARVMPGY